MMKLFKHKWTIISAILIAVATLGNFLGFYLNREDEATGYDLAIIDRQPMMLYEGQVYQYDKGTWTMLDFEEKIKQITSDEQRLCVLDTKGKLHIKGGVTLAQLEEKGRVALTTGYVLYMAEEAVTLNEKIKFVNINDHINILDFRALLKNGSILYRNKDEYHEYKPEEKIKMLSGGFALATSGNVYLLQFESHGDGSPVIPESELIYDGGDITYIDACPTANRGIGIRKDGTAVIWSDLETPDVSNWSNLVTAVHGFNYAAAVTDSGEVLFTHYDEAITADVVEYTSRWTDIVEIEAYYNSLYAVDREGNCFGVDFSSYNSVNEEGHCEEIDFEAPVVKGGGQLGDYWLKLQMYEGDYKYDTNPGPHQGSNWTGKYELVVWDSEKDEAITSYPLEEWKEPLNFQESFTLNITDYNEDGTYEVLIGQYGSSNSNIYRMYYITEDLEIGCYTEIGELNISDRDMSPVLESGEGVVTYAVYDNSTGGTITKEIDIRMLEVE